MVKISINNKKFSFLTPKKTLNPKLWKDDFLEPEISERLKEIAKDAIENLEIKSEIKDIIITGSIASYNWHRLSDIDLHIVLDFDKISQSTEIVKRMLDEYRINWNRKHEIRIKDHEVEIYFQDAKEPHESNGIWSLLSEGWAAEPVKLEPDLDLRTAEKKAVAIVKSIEFAENLFEQNDFLGSHDYSSKIRSKISRMRQSGLDKEGIYSPENLAFKMLRNSGYLGRLSELKIKSYDQMLSLNEVYIKDYFNSNKDPEYLKFEGEYELEDILDPDILPPWGETEDV